MNGGQQAQHYRTENGRLKKSIKRLLGVINQLMPGIGYISCEDYGEINDAPIEARQLISHSRTVMGVTKTNTLKNK